MWAPEGIPAPAVSPKSPNRQIAKSPNHEITKSLVSLHIAIRNSPLHKSRDRLPPTLPNALQSEGAGTSQISEPRMTLERPGRHRAVCRYAATRKLSLLALILAPFAACETIPEVPTGTATPLNALTLIDDSFTLVDATFDDSVRVGLVRYSLIPAKQIAAGLSPASTANLAARWTPLFGVELLGELPGDKPAGFDRDSAANYVSADGSVIVGTAQAPGHRTAFRWTLLTGMRTLGDLPNGVTGTWARGVSTDGRFVVGVADTAPQASAPFLWSEGTGYVLLATPTSDHDRWSASSVSADGRVVAGTRGGYEKSRAFIWTEADGVTFIDTRTDDTTYSVAMDISGDGRVVVGRTFVVDHEEAFRWTAESGIVPLGVITSEATQSGATAVSEDGAVIVGLLLKENGAMTEPFIWDTTNGMRTLRSVLKAAKVAEIDTLREIGAYDISENGRLIRGGGFNDDGYNAPWFVNLDTDAL